MAAPNSADTAQAARNDVLLSLPQMIGSLAEGLQKQGDAARQVAFLAGRAEQLAAQAWELGRSRYAPGNAARDLAASVTSFIADAGTLTQRAAREAAAAHDVATSLADEVSDLARAMGEAGGVADKAVLRERLLPMLGTLAAMPENLAEMREVASDVSGLGDRARDLADFTERLQNNSWKTGATAIAIYRELRDFADSAAAICTEMSAADDRIRQSMTQMGDLTQRLAAPEPAAPAPIPAMPTRERPAAPDPWAVRGMAWGKRTQQF